VSVTPPVPVPEPVKVNWKNVATDAITVGGVIEIALSAAAVAAKGMNIPAGDLAVISAISAGVAALVSGLANFVGAKAAAAKAKASK
jgi:hypothetical protein